MATQFTGPMDDKTKRALANLGYVTRYGGDGKAHILIKRAPWGKPGRGQRALCGATASRLDLHHEKPICNECAHKFAFQKDGQWYLIPADMQE